VNSRALDGVRCQGGVRHFIFSSTAAVYGNPERAPVREDDPTVPDVALRSLESLMTEIMLRDAGRRYGLAPRDPALFQRGGGRPARRTGQSTRSHPPH